ncbi:low-density lipoprotein receptor-related protein 8-like isoform X2 [Acanthochromis polyacanthus]|uniref:low-density lipoprotein receptor-related protein 8-like isoform X2 n=1 Tax=Acanthochromis polyacanthus TaxID=80966 RepID=UPI0022347862|nr:low-density lipoprotein receptor-related protein 8-like isoform X2 [Acanthochromis polyacanthus]
MGDLGGAFLVVAAVVWLHISGAALHSLPSCHQQLEFRCSDGSCVSKLKVCDGRKNCEDGSDERHCSHACSAGFFSCGPSDACLHENKLCDGRTDCKDGRDETQELCGSGRQVPQKSPKCAVSEFQCRDGSCIPHSWRCDHSADCPDASDEDRCDQDECRVNNGGCSHYCVDQPMGFHCDCPENMRLVEDTHCEEVDACLESDVCDQLCVHVNGSFTCDCLEGYHMNPVTRECNAKGDEPQLVFTTSEGIQWKSITGSESRKLAPHLPGPGPLATVASNRMVYWAQQGQGSIYRISLDGRPQEAVLVLEVQGSVSGLAVDWIHQLLYWTSTETGSLGVALLDGSARRQLITGLDQPSAVAVDPLRGLLFWTQCGSSPKIERAGLDGRDRTTLVFTSIRHPVALSLDMPRQLLYWFDEGMRSISRVNLEGRHRKTVVESNGYMDRCLGLAVFEGFVYWSEEVTHSICRANKHNGRNLQVLLSDITSPGGVSIIQAVLQPNAVCGRPGTVCRHKCVVHLRAEHPEFSCFSPEMKQNRSQEIPAVTHTVPTSTLSDPAFAGILSLIMFLSVLLAGMALWWWREELRPSRSLTVQSFTFKESQDPLIIQGPAVAPNTCLVKAREVYTHTHTNTNTGAFIYVQRRDGIHSAARVHLRCVYMCVSDL